MVEEVNKVKTGAVNMDVEEREAKRKSREGTKLKLLGTGLGKGSPDWLSLGDAVVQAGTGLRGRNRRSTGEWLQLIENCVAEPGEWFNRKFYYKSDSAPGNNAQSRTARWFQNQGDTGDTKTLFPGQKALIERIKEVVKIYGVNFEAQYTPALVRSDNLEKGDVMHVVFIKAIRVKSPKASDVFALSNGSDADNLIESGV